MGIVSLSDRDAVSQTRRLILYVGHPSSSHYGMQESYALVVSHGLGRLLSGAIEVNVRRSEFAFLMYVTVSNHLIGIFPLAQPARWPPSNSQKRGLPVQHNTVLTLETILHLKLLICSAMMRGCHLRTSRARKSLISLRSDASCSPATDEMIMSSALQLWQKVKDHGILSISAIIGLFILYTIRYFASPYRKLPPGPRGYPIIGNLLELRSEQWLKFTEWRKKYGQFVTSIFCCLFANLDLTR